MKTFMKALGWLVFGTSVVAGVIIGGFFLLIKQTGVEASTPPVVPEVIKQEAVMTFRVTIPENTPKGDTVYLHTHPDVMFQMDKAGKNEYSLTLNEDQVELDVEGRAEPIIEYRYTRNGLNYITAEYMEPDTAEYFWEERGRRVAFVDGGEQVDEVERWRWMGEERETKTEGTALKPSGKFEPRVNDRPFRSGQVIQDLYLPEFDDFMDSTAEHMADKGYGWVTISPSWDWVEEDPVPKLGNPWEQNPNYPDDEKLIEHIKAFKRAGLKVVVAPQHCCTEIDSSFRRGEWWGAYYDEIDRMLVHFAKVSEEAGADAFYYAAGNEIDETELDREEVFRSIWKNVHKEFSGEVGQMVWSFPPQEGVPGIIPTAEWISWGDELDFFVYQGDLAISDLDDPTDEDLMAGAGLALDATKGLFETYGKPVMVQTTYAAVEKTWRGADWYDIGVMNAAWGGESEWQNGTYVFSGADQARVMHAYFEAIRTRPWITGFENFGYWHWEMPFVPDMSVRGKAAEDIWVKWNKLLNR